MLEFFGISNETAIIFISAVLAAASFMAFASLFLNREEKKERYRDIVQKRRKALFDAAKRGEDRNIIKDKDKTFSARESMMIRYKVQQMMGDMGVRVRDKMLQAGYRNPNAPFKYLIARISFPLILGSLCFISASSPQYDLEPWMISLITLGALGFGYFLPDILIKNQILKRQQEIELSFPDALDMMLICVQGGIGLEQTVERISNEVSEQSPILAEELGILSAEMSMLNDRRTALADFARRVGSSATKSFSTALIQADQYGTSVSQALRVLAEDVRDIRMQKAEEKALALPPKLTVPMILFFLPSLFIVILGPVGIEISSM